jgi:hypothetical protein
MNVNMKLSGNSLPDPSIVAAVPYFNISIISHMIVLGAIECRKARNLRAFVFAY